MKNIADCSILVYSVESTFGGHRRMMRRPSPLMAAQTMTPSTRETLGSRYFALKALLPFGLQHRILFISLIRKIFSSEKMMFDHLLTSQFR